MPTGIGKTGSGIATAIALCAIALAGAGCAGAKPSPEEALQEASQELRQAVSENIEDPARRRQMLDLVAQIESTQRHYSLQAAEFAARYKVMNADYNAPRARFEELFSTFNAQRISSRDRVLELHFQLTALATAAEWQRIGKAEARMYSETQTARAGAGGA